MHVAPFDPSRYPPLINCVQMSREAGIASRVIASVEPLAPELFEPGEVEIATMRSSGISQIAALVHRVRSHVERSSPALVVGHNGRGLLAASASEPSAPVVYHCHDFDVREGTLLEALVRRASRGVSETWVPAPERVDGARARGAPSPISVVRNCPRLRRALPPRGRLRAWLGADAPPHIIVRAGGIGETHYILETVRALPALPDATFVVVGRGGEAYLAQCHAEAARLNVARRFRVHPFVSYDELAELVVDADVAMNVYRPDDANSSAPAPNKVYDAMAVGVPSVVAEGNSVAVDVESSGAGIAVPVGDHAALAGALGAVLANRERYSSAARAAHERTFHAEAQHVRTALGHQLRHAGRGGSSARARAPS